LKIATAHNIPMQGRCVSHRAGACPNGILCVGAIGKSVSRKLDKLYAERRKYMDNGLQIYIQEILNSREYIEYAQVRDKIKKYPDLKMQIDEFRTKNYEIQRSRDAAFEKLEAFEREYKDFMDMPMVSEFLEAELAFCRMMQRNNSMIMEAIQFE